MPISVAYLRLAPMLFLVLSTCYLRADDAPPSAAATKQGEPGVAAFGARAGRAAKRSDDNVRGERVVHLVELADPVSPTTLPRVYKVIQSLDDAGFPVGFSLSFETHVCNDNQCLPVDVTMVWDALGYFERFTYPPGKPLTKKEHVPFTADDYAKLDRILRDRSSILGGWSLAFLEQTPDFIEGVDAVTAPTPTTVQDSVIEDAAYTSWALWHWANGGIVPELRRLTEQKCTPSYLKHLLVSEDRRHSDYALDYVIEHHPSDPQYMDGVVQILENGEREQIARSLDFLSQAIPDKQKLHAQLIESCLRMRAADCPVVLQKLAGEPNLPPDTLEALTGRFAELPYFPIHLILRMLEQRKFASEKTISHVAALLNGDDFFVARRAYEHLAQQDLDAPMQTKVDAFRQKNSDRL